MSDTGHSEQAPRPAPIDKPKPASDSSGGEPQVTAAPLSRNTDTTTRVRGQQDTNDAQPSQGQSDERRTLTIANRTEDVEIKALLDAQEQHRTRQRELAASKNLFRKLTSPRHWWQAGKLKFGEDYLIYRGVKRLQEAKLANANANATMDILKKGAAANGTAGLTEERAASHAKLEQIAQGDVVGDASFQRIEDVAADSAMQKLLVDQVIRPIVETPGATEKDIQDKLRNFVEANHNNPDVRDQIQRLFGTAEGDRNWTKFNERAKYFATDLLDTTALIRQDIADNRYAMDAIADNVDIRLANTKWAADINVNMTGIDRFVSKVQRSKLGRFVNAPTIAASAAAVVFGGIRATGVFARRAAPFTGVVSLGAGAVVGGVARGFERHKEVVRDRSAHLADVQYGMQVDTTKRGWLADKLDVQKKLAEFDYRETASVAELLTDENTNRRALGGDTRAFNELMTLDLSVEQNREALARRVAEMRTRLSFSAQEHAGYLRFDSAGKTSSEQAELGRLAIVKAIAEGRKAITDALIASGKDKTTAEAEVVDMLRKDGSDWEQIFIKDKNQQDKLFRRFAFWSSVRHTGLATVSALTFGIVGQELFALGARGVGGLGRTTADNLSKGNVVTRTIANAADWLGKRAAPKTTILESGINKIAGTHIGEATTTTSVSADKLLSSDTKSKEVDLGQLTGAEDAGLPKLNIPEGTHFEPNPNGDGTFNLVVDADPSKVLISGAGVVDGQLVYNAAASILTPDHIVVNPGDVISEARPVLGEGGIWTEIGERTAPTQWLGNNTDIPDLNELGFHNYIENDGNTIVLSAKGMTPEGSFNSSLNPSSYDIPQSFREGRGIVAISIPGIEEKVILPLDTNGEFRINLNDTDPTHMVTLNNGTQIPMSTLADMLVDRQAMEELGLNRNGELASEVHPERRAIFNIAGENGQRGTMNIGIMKDLPDGTQAVVSAATIFGTGEVPGQIGIPTEGPGSITITGTDIFSAPTIETTEGFESIAIPLPYSPRLPLKDGYRSGREGREPLKNLYEFGYGYGGVTKLDERIQGWLDKHKSPTLERDPNADLDPYEEARLYFERQNPEYYEEIKALAAEISTPPTPGLRAIICIPVAGHQEGDNIYTTLQNYTKQTVSNDQFEVLLFVNRPDADLEGNPTSSQETMDAIARFQQDYPDFPVRVVEKVFPREQAKIGTFRKYGADIALYRHMQRGPDAGDIIILSNDADQKGVAPQYLEKFIRNFDSNKHAEAFLGQLDWDPEAYAEYPIVHIGTRLFQVLNTIGRARSGRMVSSGANSAFRGSAYAAIGGYITELEGGEDIAIGKAIIAARGEDHTRLAYAAGTRLYTSARRAVDALRSGLPPIDQWGKGFSAFDDEVRRLKLGTAASIDFDDPQQVAELKEGLEWVINITVDQYEAGDRLGKDSELYKKALSFLGIKYELQDGRLVITNMESVTHDLRRYRAIAVLQRDIISGKAGPGARERLKELSASFRVETHTPEPSGISPFDADEPAQLNDPAEIAKPDELLLETPAAPSTVTLPPPTVTREKDKTRPSETRVPPPARTSQTVTTQPTGSTVETGIDVDNPSPDTLSTRLEEFNRREKLALPEIPPFKYTIADLRESEEIRQEGDFIICLDKKLGSEPVSLVYPGYDIKTGEIKIFKFSSRRYLQRVATRYAFPEGVLIPEETIDRGATDPIIQTYQTKIEDGDEIIRIYPPASIDMAEYLTTTGKLDPKTSTAMIIKIGEALKSLHKQGITHFDVGVNNILINPDGTIHLTDLDNAIFASSNPGRLQFAGANVFIQAPEIYESKVDNPVLVDVYQTAALLCEVVTGTNPFFHIPWNPEETNEVRRQRFYEAHKAGNYLIPDDVPEPLKTVIRKGLEPDPHNRYQSMDEMLLALLDAYAALDQAGNQAGSPVPDITEPTPPKVNRTRKSREKRVKTRKKTVRVKSSESLRDRPVSTEAGRARVGGREIPPPSEPTVAQEIAIGIPESIRIQDLQINGRRVDRINISQDTAMRISFAEGDPITFSYSVRSPEGNAYRINDFLRMSNDEYAVRLTRLNETTEETTSVAPLAQVLEWQQVLTPSESSTAVPFKISSPIENAGRLYPGELIVNEQGEICSITETRPDGITVTLPSGPISVSNSEITSWGYLANESGDLSGLDTYLRSDVSHIDHAQRERVVEIAHREIDSIANQNVDRGFDRIGAAQLFTAVLIMYGDRARNNQTEPTEAEMNDLVERTFPYHVDDRDLIDAIGNIGDRLYSEIFHIFQPDRLRVEGQARAGIR